MATKACPYCAEEIKAEAIKCRHCGSMVAGPAPGGEAVSGVVTNKARTTARRRWPQFFAGMIGVLVFAGLTYYCIDHREEVRTRLGLPPDSQAMILVWAVPPVLGLACLLVAIVRLMKCAYCGKVTDELVFTGSFECGKCKVLNVVMWE